MPLDSYSYAGESGQRPFAITEPDDGRLQRRNVEDTEAEHSARSVQAKEPDRQGTTRRASRSGRRAGMAESEQEEDSRGRTAQRAGNRRGVQARRGSERGQSARRAAGPDNRTGRQKKSRRGFAAMSPEQQREIARKGGLTVSRNRRHMADIGRVGGEHSHGGRRARR
jgi:general stress protein YciG